MNVPMGFFLRSAVAPSGLDVVVAFRSRLEQLNLLNAEEVNYQLALAELSLARLRVQIPQPSPMVVHLTSRNQRDDLDPLTFDTEPKPGKLDMEALRYR